jgi:PAS domain-containing protein
MENELARVFDALAGMVWTAFPGGLIDFANQRWRDYTGLKPGDAHATNWQASVHPDDLPALAERVQSMPASPEPIEVEARLRGHHRRLPLVPHPRRAVGRRIRPVRQVVRNDHRHRASEYGPKRRPVSAKLASSWSWMTCLPSWCC